MEMQVVAAKGTDIPWGQIVTAAAAILGVTVSGLFTRWNDTAKWRRERVEAYAELLNLSVTMAMPSGSLFTPQQEAERTVVWGKALQTVRLLCSGPVREAADRLGSIMSGMVRQHESPDWSTRAERYTNDLLGAQNAFISAARKELRIK
jgi:hypothetical protein